MAENKMEEILTQWGNKNTHELLKLVFHCRNILPGVSAHEPEPWRYWTTGRAFLGVGSVRMEVGRWVKLRTIKEAFFFPSPLFPPLNTAPLVKCLKWDKAKPVFHVAILKYRNVSRRLNRFFLRVSCCQKNPKTKHKFLPGTCGQGRVFLCH